MCKVRGPATAGSLLEGFSDSSGTVPPWLSRPSLSRVGNRTRTQSREPTAGVGGGELVLFLEAPQSALLACAQAPSGLAVGPADSALRGHPPGHGGPSRRHPGGLLGPSFRAGMPGVSDRPAVESPLCRSLWANHQGAACESRLSFCRLNTEEWRKRDQSREGIWSSLPAQGFGLQALPGAGLAQSLSWGAEIL